MYTPKGELNDKLVEAVTTKEVIEKITASNSLEEVYQVVKRSEEHTSELQSPDRT